MPNVGISEDRGRESGLGIEPQPTLDDQAADFVRTRYRALKQELLELRNQVRVTKGKLNDCERTARIFGVSLLPTGRPITDVQESILRLLATARRPLRAVDIYHLLRADGFGCHIQTPGVVLRKLRGKHLVRQDDAGWMCVEANRSEE